MDKSSNASLAEQLVAVQDWWRDAGVDHVFGDDPLALLGDEDEADPAAKKAVAIVDPVEAEPAPPAIKAEDLPQDLASFQQWLSDPASELPCSPKRLAPRGAKEADIMLLVPMPEVDDQEALLEGPQGKLISNMLRALGIVSEQAYIASALPAHMSLPDWEDLDRQGLGTITQHHIALARPKKLLVFGRALAPLIEQSPMVTQSLTIRAPEHLLTNARQRARAWQSLLEWTA